MGTGIQGIEVSQLMIGGAGVRTNALWGTSVPVPPRLLKMPPIHSPPTGVSGWIRGGKLEGRETRGVTSLGLSLSIW